MRHEFVSLPKLEPSRNVTSNVSKQGNQNAQNNMIASFSFASTAHVTQWLSYLTQRLHIFTRRSNLTPQRTKNTVNDLSVVLKSLSILGV